MFKMQSFKVIRVVKTLLVIVTLCQTLQYQPNIRITTLQQGPISGLLSFTENGSKYFSFLGIPYAVPPVGHLRFKDPIRHPGWQRELFAYEYGSPCPQWDVTSASVIGQEDCLTLNVFTPHINSPSFCPVMFFIHGGAFMYGSSSQYPAAKLLNQPVVIVTVNYRLGVLGFLGTEDVASPGNYGMMDLVLALQWVRENICHFGGDHQRVTIFGQNAGAAAVSHLILSPLARGLFWLGITQSGTSLCDWAVEENPREFAILLATTFGCDMATGESIVECLRLKSPEELIHAQHGRLTYSVFPLRTAPVIDQGLRSQAFLIDDPERLLQSGDFSRIPIISGVTENEGLLFVLQIFLRYAEKLSFDATFFEDIVLPESIDAMTDTWYTTNKISHIKNFYFKNVQDFSNIDQVLPPFVDVVSDVVINSCNDKFVKLYSRFAPVYMYVFSHHGLCTYIDNFVSAIGKTAIQSEILQNGVSHADDLLYLFNLPNIDTNYSPQDRQVEEIMTFYWTTFAHDGNPNYLKGMDVYSKNGKSNNVTVWSSFREDNRVYFNITVYPYMSKDFRQFELSIFDYISLLPVIPERLSDPQKPYFTATWILTGFVIFFLVLCIVLATLLVIKTRTGSYSTNSVAK